MNKIRIVTTKGCVGCKIAENLVKLAIESSNKNIKLEIIDNLDENYGFFIKNYAISDFPAIVFMRGDTPLSIHIGTLPVPQILKIIDVWF